MQPSARWLVQSKTDTAQDALEAASPEHLRERMQYHRASATGKKAEETLNSGSNHQMLLQRRVDETIQRLKALDANKVAREDRKDELEATLATDRVAPKAKKDEQAVYLEENQGLEDVRQEPTDQQPFGCATRNAFSSPKPPSSADEDAHHCRKTSRSSTHGQELIEAGLSVTDTEDLKNARTCPNFHAPAQPEGFGNVNMRAVEQMMSAAHLDLIGRVCDPAETTEAPPRCDRTIGISTQRTIACRARKGHENFKKSYHDSPTVDGASCSLRTRMNRSKAGLSCGGNSQVFQSQSAATSGGEQSMAAWPLSSLSKITTPVRSTTLTRLTKTSMHTTLNASRRCAESAKRAQFIMVTLRKVSLKLADHHIGFTHGGDGCSRRILDFDRERAIALGEAALKEAQKDADKNETRILDAVAASEDMPTVPEPLAVPKSLGGLLDHMHDDAPEPNEGALDGLMERTQDLTEDINERAEVAAQVLEMDAEADPEHIEAEELNEQ